jgi:putative transposase
VVTLKSNLRWYSDAFEIRCDSADTVAFGRSLGFLVCTTPPYSPESNGMAEAFVKTFKRDYAAINSVRDAATVLAQLGAWFEDYNVVHPHKGLRMRSPREARLDAS